VPGVSVAEKDIVDMLLQVYHPAHVDTPEHTWYKARLLKASVSLAEKGKIDMLLQVYHPAHVDTPEHS
jgi:hypothetical protein